jgi:hypothetical protein
MKPISWLAFALIAIQAIAQTPNSQSPQSQPLGVNASISGTVQDAGTGQRN